MDNPIRIVIADHHSDYRASVVVALNCEHDLQVVGQAHSALEALQVTLEQHPDILLLDHRLPGDSMSIISALHTFRPNTKIALLATNFDAEQANSATLAGVNGCLFKGVGASQMADSLRIIQSTIPDNQIMLFYPEKIETIFTIT